MAFPVMVRVGTPAAAAACTARRTPGVSCCRGSSSVPSTSLQISCTRRRPERNSSAADEVEGMASAVAACAAGAQLRAPSARAGGLLG